MFLKKISYHFIGVFFLFLVPLQITYAAADNLAWLTDATVQVQAWKTRTENKARAIKNHPDLSGNEIREAKEKYLAAKIAVDGWLQGLKTELASNSPDDLENSSADKRRLDDAAGKISEFNTYANSILERGVVAVPILREIAIGLGALASVIYDYNKKGKQEQRERILQELDKLSLKDFDAL